jgi:purine nucleosidase
VTHKIILDTDPGIDDSFAIAYAIAHPEIELLALTTIYGNVTIDQATDNALKILNAFGGQADVVRGEARPLAITPNTPSDYVHGANGVGGYEFPETSNKEHDLSAAEYIVKAVNEHPCEITICAVGPLTNIAKALELDPTIISKVKEIVVMGGAVFHVGNVTPVAEANIWNDPHAADIVFAANWPLTLAPMDCTMPVTFNNDDLQMLAKANPKMGIPLEAMSEFYINFYRNAAGLTGLVPHDVMALMWVTAPGTFNTRKGALATVNDGPAIGQTLFLAAGDQTLSNAFDGRPNHTVLVGTDIGMFRSNYFSTLVAAG